MTQADAKIIARILGAEPLLVKHHDEWGVRVECPNGHVVVLYDEYVNEYEDADEAYDGSPTQTIWMI